MLKINYVSVFLFIIVIAEFIAIISFSIIALIKHKQGLIIEVKKPVAAECNYPSLDILDTKKVCKDNKTYFYIDHDNVLKYTLGTKQNFYLNICNKLCGGSTLKTGNCSQGNPIGFKECVDELQPQSGCKNSSVPLVYSQSSGKKIFYYAQSVMLSSANC